MPRINPHQLVTAEEKEWFEDASHQTDGAGKDKEENKRKKTLRERGERSRRRKRERIKVTWKRKRTSIAEGGGGGIKGEEPRRQRGTIHQAGRAGGRARVAGAGPKQLERRMEVKATYTSRLAPLPPSRPPVTDGPSPARD
ncbi:hypothetical protein E2C01_012209 [Portunus trituberculatus]|uniref:Uncharacterized protein n=1 Tax=Portunus trituberculatus TaxID=210409 RepID=A0A5B7DDJ7_PORTR|nr:hypothetical protein [Portunus trituberculatus]